MGYLEQPHTSAGRVPTPLGYRMYVNELMEHKDLTAEETQAITQSLTGRHQRGELMTDASRLASQLTNYPAVTLTASARRHRSGASTSFISTPTASSSCCC